jgi:folate-binding protein YgfZ
VEATSQALELDAQYRALREEAGYVDRSERGMLIVSGADAVEFLQGQLTNDIEAVTSDRGCYAALLDRKGRMQADMRVLRLESTHLSLSRLKPLTTATGEIWLDLEREALDAVARNLGMYRVGREVEVEDVSGRWAITGVIGPAAAEVTGVGPLEPEHAQRYFERDRLEVLAAATNAGLDLITRADQADALRTALEAAGAVEVSPEAAEILRVESGRPRFGHEMGTSTIPEEAGINDRAVSFTKGCYIGQETVARLHYKGKPNRHLRGLRLSAPASAGDPVRLSDREIGKLGTTVISPAHGPIALAILRREAEPGSEVTVGDATLAEVVELPF